MKIRKARMTDVKAIHSLVKQHASQGELLPRPLNDLYEKVQEFVVAEDGKDIVGCGALHVTWEDLAEVRSLIVRSGHQGKGIGAKIARVLEKRAEALGVPKVFALSFKPGFFRAIGYSGIAREKLPHKIWRDCIKCPLFPNCGETALIKELEA